MKEEAITPETPCYLGRENLLKSLLAEGFHTAFRKVGDHPDLWKIWKLIKQLPDNEWEAVIDFVYDGVKGEIE